MASSDELGFALEDGTFRVTINEKHVYTATHKDGRRISSLEAINDSLPSIFMMGCSYTYGMGVDDTENFSYLVQTELDNYRIQNFGVPGYGTVQSLLQLQKSIEDGDLPEIVVINFCAFHEERNVLSPKYRQHLNIGFAGSSEHAKLEMEKGRFPYFEKGEIRYETWNGLYQNWAGRETFATVNYLQSNADKSVNEGLDPRGVTLTIFRKIKELCDSNGILLLVTSLERTSEASHLLTELNSRDFTTVDISLNLSTKKYTNLPYDSHPNAKAHEHFAEKILNQLKVR